MNVKQAPCPATYTVKKNSAYFLVAKLWAATLFMSLAGCSFTSDPDVAVDTVTLVVDPDANDNSATTVDLIFVYKKELLDALVKMNAKDYFKAADQIRRDNPEMVDVFRWEVVPCQTIGPQPLNLPELSMKTSYLLGALIFASYTHPGAHRIRLGSIGDVKIHLTNVHFFVEPATKK